MGNVGCRVLIVGKDGVLRRFPWARYGRLYHQPASERLPEFANQWVRFVDLVVELENRRPVRILRTFYVRMRLDRDGRPDPKEMDAVMRLSMESASLGVGTDPSIIEGSHHWARKKFEERFRWKPTPFEERTIRRMVLGTTARPDQKT